MATGSNFKFLGEIKAISIYGTSHLACFTNIEMVWEGLGLAILVGGKGAFLIMFLMLTKALFIYNSLFEFPLKFPLLIK